MQGKGENVYCTAKMLKINTAAEALRFTTTKKRTE